MVSVPNKDLSKFAWLSIAAAIITIALKTGAWALTGSVGLLSDAAESIVNLVAAAVILVTSVERFVHPRGIDNVGVGLLISVLASLVNGGVALVLLRAGKEYRSLTLTADARHLMTDVVTSVGVLVGVGLVWLTGWERLDPIVAFAVGVNIIVTGAKLISQSAEGLLDVTLPAEENQRIVDILRTHTTENIRFHALQTRVSGRDRHATVHVLVPGDWSIRARHAYIDGCVTRASRSRGSRTCPEVRAPRRPRPAPSGPRPRPHPPHAPGSPRGA